MRLLLNYFTHTHKTIYLQSFDLDMMQEYDTKVMNQLLARLTLVLNNEIIYLKELNM